MDLNKLSHFIASQAIQPFTAFVKVGDLVRPWTFINGDLAGHTLVALAKEVFDSEFAFNNWKDHINSIDIPAPVVKEVVSLEQAIEGSGVTPQVCVEPAPTKKRGKK